MNDEYIGIGLSAQDARKKMYQEASKNGIEIDATSIEYTVFVDGVEGIANKDYNAALDSALGKKGINKKELKGLDFEVVAKGYFIDDIKENQPQTKPRGSGSIRKGNLTTELTDLM